MSINNLRDMLQKSCICYDDKRDIPLDNLKMM